MYRPSFSRSFPLLYGGREKAFLKRAFFSAPNDFSISGKRFFVLRQMIFRFQPNDLSFSWDWIAYMQKICKTATHIPYKYTRRCSVCYGSPVFGLSDKTKTLSFWTEILPYSNKKTFYETEEQKNKKAKWLLREKYVLLCLCLISLSTNPPTIFRPTEN